MVAVIIQFIGNVLDLMHTLIWCISSVGHVIVAGVIIIFSAVGNILSNLMVLLSVLQDSVAYFFQDVISFVESTNEEVGNGLQLFADFGAGVSHTFSTVLYGLTNVLSSYRSFFKVLAIVKQLLVDIGGGFWFLITFSIVNSVVLVKLISYYIYSSIMSLLLSVWNMISKVLVFLIDMPPESILGSIVFITIVKLGIVFRNELKRTLILCYWRSIRISIDFYDCIKGYLNSNNIDAIIAEYFQQNDLQENRNNCTGLDPLDANSYCVICNERYKCILLLPCKHVCLCNECCNQLYNYQRQCPMCRSFIRRLCMVHGVGLFLMEPFSRSRFYGSCNDSHCSD